MTYRVPEDTSYEVAREALIDVVRQLEVGASSLDESVALWEKAEALADYCEVKLQGATQRFEEQLAQRTSGSD